MGADSKPYARLSRALKAGQLPQAEAAARDMAMVPLEVALRMVLLMIEKQDPRWERAAVKWLGRALAARPSIGLQHAAEAADAMAGLAGVMPEVNRARLSLLLRNAGLVEPAKILERS